MRKIKKGDRVVVITGKYKHKTGVVTQMVGEDKLVVSGVNVVKKHRKPQPFLEKPGGIFEEERPIHVSNVMLYNPETKKPDRVGIKVDAMGKKMRVFKSTQKLVGGV